MKNRKKWILLFLSILCCSACNRASISNQSCCNEETESFASEYETVINEIVSDEEIINDMNTFEAEKVRLLTDEKINEWRTESDTRIQSILLSPNMDIPEDAVVYYVSNNGYDRNDGRSPSTAWKSLNRVNSMNIPKGSYVCFERTGIWRGRLTAKAGVTYTAYGEGCKPKIYRSEFNGADPSLWTKTDVENIWSIKMDKNDIGTLIFNDGESCGIKCVIRTEADGTTYNNTTGKPFVKYTDLHDDLHFFHDYYDTGILYLYSEENPGERFESIEFNSKGNIINVEGDGVTIDNLCIKYGGAHGVGAGTVKNLTVRNCEFGWIGGSIQSEGIFGRNYGTRYGNAVEIYGGCENFTVTDNYIYQIYDAGITQQYNLANESEIKYQRNMIYARNVIEYCNYSIEYFLGGVFGKNPSRMENFLIEDNHMWYAGYGFCEQRPDENCAAHIKSWTHNNRATGYVIRNNLMFKSKDMLIEAYSSLTNPDKTDCMPILENNNFAGAEGDQFGTVAYRNNHREKYDSDITEYLGDRSHGDIFWFRN